ncbi:ferritin family protein [Mesotoga sp. UBA5557]|uniref:ferritin family protein n=1 Tax=Mesotoga sp. UBA5557 TaxID=1946857 RepID=UPI0025CC9C3B|nr:ferritin family protein [Mesotoga sp. UBA5557]
MLSPHEVLEVALRIETEGENFYRELAESAHNDRQGPVFRFLSSQERSHADTFRTLLRRFEEEAIELINWDDARQYMAALTEASVFSDELKDAMSRSDYKKAIEHAIEVEKKSIAFYESLLKNSKADTVEALEKVISEEKNHVELLEGLR